MQTITTIGSDIAKSVFQGPIHGSTDQACDVKILPANPEPSTHGTKRTSQDGPAMPVDRGRSEVEAGSPNGHV
jgi:hypothetical protein